MKILAIETSCDETGVCLIDGAGTIEAGDVRFTVLGNALYSQIAVHAQYGGVYPNLARREHVNNVVPMLTECLKQSGDLRDTGSHKVAWSDVKDILAREPELFDQLQVFSETYARPDIDAIAVTYGPGLEPALWVGVNFAKALSALWGVPIVAVNHMEGHSLISMIEGAYPNYSFRPVAFPLLSVLISGGHTELVLSKSWRTYEKIGETYDDAVGEAFDKVARLMDLPYPGGPVISRLAKEAREEHVPERKEFALPRPVLHDGTLNFSFSGLKTAVRRVVETHGLMSDEDKKALSREFENAAADVIVEKTLRAVLAHGVRTVIVGGGVSANEYIRMRLRDIVGEHAEIMVPEPSLATDNAFMIAIAAYFDAAIAKFAVSSELRATGNLSL